MTKLTGKLLTDALKLPQMRHLSKQELFTLALLFAFQ
jgi:hypothetical protein